MVQNGRPRAFVPASFAFPAQCIQKDLQTPAKERLGSAIISLPFVAYGLATGGQLAKACRPAGEIDAAMPAKRPEMSGRRLSGCAGFRHRGPHGLDVEGLLPKNVVNMILRRMVLASAHPAIASAVGVDLLAQSVAVGRRQRGSEPFYPDKHVTVPIRWRRRPDGHRDRDADEEQVQRERAQQQPARGTASIAGRAWAMLMAALPSTRRARR